MPALPRSTSRTPACGASPRLTWTRATASLPTVTTSRAGVGAAARGSGAGARCSADVAHPPILLSTSESAPKSRKSAQSRGVGRKATQLRRIRSATSRREISGLESSRITSVLRSGCDPCVVARHGRALTRRASKARARVTVGCRPCVRTARSEEHTSELQSLTNLVCRLLLEKKKTIEIRGDGLACYKPEVARALAAAPEGAGGDTCSGAEATSNGNDAESHCARVLMTAVSGG